MWIDAAKQIHGMSPFALARYYVRQMKNGLNSAWNSHMTAILRDLMEKDGLTALSELQHEVVLRMERCCPDVSRPSRSLVLRRIEAEKRRLHQREFTAKDYVKLILGTAVLGTKFAHLNQLLFCESFDASLLNLRYKRLPSRPAADGGRAKNVRQGPLDEEQAASLPAAVAALGQDNWPLVAQLMTVSRQGPSAMGSLSGRDEVNDAAPRPLTQSLKPFSGGHLKRAYHFQNCRRHHPAAECLDELQQ